MINERNASLKSKTIVLLAVPLVFQLTITAGLWFLFLGAESKAKNIERSRDITVSLGIFSYSFLDATTALFSCALDQKQASQVSLFSRHLENCDNYLKELEAAVAKTHRTSKSLPKLAATLNKLRGLDVSFADLSSDTLITQRFARLNQLRKKLRDLYQDLKAAEQAIIDEERLFENKETRAARAISYSIQALLTILVVVGIALTFILGRLFAASTLTKLAVVEENAKRIGARRQLLPPLTGKNEIAFIDNTLHAAYDQLNFQELERQRVVSMLSHDLRSPLLALKGSIALLAEGTYGTLPEPAQRRLEQADRVADKIVVLATQFLSAQRQSVEAISMTRITMASLYDECLPTVSEAAKESGVDIECRDREIAINADAKSMTRVLTNLLTNAIKFSPRGTTITVSATELADRVRIDVKDHGSGIEKEDLPFVFEPYYQTKLGRQKKDSSGLGLLICKELVGLNQGAITVESTTSVGTVFSVLLTKPLN